MSEKNLRYSLKAPLNDGDTETKHMDAVQTIPTFVKTAMLKEYAHSHLKTIFVKLLLQNGRSIMRN